MIYALLVLELVLMVATMWYLAFIIESLSNLRKDRVVYHGSDLGEQGGLLIQIIKKYTPDTSRYTLVEPGAGLGKVAEFLTDAFTWKKVIAVEVGPVIFWIAKLRAKFRKIPVQFIRRNIFAFEFPRPSVVYCYLTTEMLDRLYREGKLSGSLVISLTFPMTNVPATETIALKSWQKQLLVYDFRKQR